MLLLEKSETDASILFMEIQSVILGITFTVLILFVQSILEIQWITAMILMEMMSLLMGQ